MAIRDTRQVSRLVAPQQWRRPAPTPPSLLSVYEKQRTSGWSAVLREFESQQAEYHKQLSLWVSQQSQGAAASVTLAQLPQEWALYRFTDNVLALTPDTKSTGAFSVTDGEMSGSAYGYPGINAYVPANYVVDATFKLDLSLPQPGVVTLQSVTGETSVLLWPSDIWNDTPTQLTALAVLVQWFKIS